MVVVRVVVVVVVRVVVVGVEHVEAPQHLHGRRHPELALHAAEYFLDVLLVGVGALLHHRLDRLPLDALEGEHGPVPLVHGHPRRVAAAPVAVAVAAAPPHGSTSACSAARGLRRRVGGRGSEARHRRPAAAGARTTLRK